MKLTEKTIVKLYTTGNLTDEEFLSLLESHQFDSLLFHYADQVRRRIYENKVYVRGLIEFTNFCKNDCFYCGIRKSNSHATRYRLTKEEILDCCRDGYTLGIRTFVLQGGEDCYFTDEILCDIVSTIHQSYPDCAITLSIGEKERDSYQSYFDAGATRYLLRHETADSSHYKRLHPSTMKADRRKACLFHLKDIGYQTGSGFMVGSPYQETRHILSDLRFLQELSPDMIGIGPYLTHLQTPFSDKPNGSLSLTLRLIAILRLMFPHALLPATTALGTIASDGRERGLKAGANVVMPNLSPTGVRKLYSLYENKICTGEESAQCSQCLKERICQAGYQMVTDIGDVKR